MWGPVHPSDLDSSAHPPNLYHRSTMPQTRQDSGRVSGHAFSSFAWLPERQRSPQQPVQNLVPLQRLFGWRRQPMGPHRRVIEQGTKADRQSPARGPSGLELPSVFRRSARSVRRRRFGMRQATPWLESPVHPSKSSVPRFARPRRTWKPGRTATGCCWPSSPARPANQAPAACRRAQRTPAGFAGTPSVTDRVGQTITRASPVNASLPARREVQLPMRGIHCSNNP